MCVSVCLSVPVSLCVSACVCVSVCISVGEFLCVSWCLFDRDVVVWVVVVMEVVVRERVTKGDGRWISTRARGVFFIFIFLYLFIYIFIFIVKCISLIFNFFQAQQSRCHGYRSNATSNRSSITANHSNHSNHSKSQQPQQSAESQTGVSVAKSAHARSSHHIPSQPGKETNRKASYEMRPLNLQRH